MARDSFTERMEAGKAVAMDQRNRGPLSGPLSCLPRPMAGLFLGFPPYLELRHCGPPACGCTPIVR